MRNAVLTTRLMDSDSATNKGRAGRWLLSPNSDKKNICKNTQRLVPTKQGSKKCSPCDPAGKQKLKT